MATIKSGNDFSPDSVPVDVKGKDIEETEDEIIEKSKVEEEEEVDEEEEEIKEEEEEEVKEEEDEEEEKSPQEETQNQGLKKKKDLSIEEKAALYDELEPEYTRKSQILADLTKNRKIKEEEETVEKSNINIDDELKKLAEKKGIDESELKNTVNLIGELLPKMGYVKAEDVSKHTYQSILNSEIDKFCEENPEIATSDEKWNILNKYFTETYKLPKDPKKIGKLLKKVKEECFGKNDESVNETKILAKIRKNKMATVGGGGGGSSKTTITKKSSKLTNEQINALKLGGFTDKEIKETYG